MSPNFPLAALDVKDLFQALEFRPTLLVLCVPHGYIAALRVRPGGVALLAGRLDVRVLRDVHGAGGGGGGGGARGLNAGGIPPGLVCVDDGANEEFPTS